MNIGKTGSAGEMMAVDYLKKKKYRIISRNYQTHFGELDIICSDKKNLVFVEVKTRSKNYMVSGRDSVTHQKQKRIIKAAMQYLQSYPTKLQPRFDVIEITIDEKDSIVHFENAFGTEGYHGFI